MHDAVTPLSPSPTRVPPRVQGYDRHRWPLGERAARLVDALFVTDPLADDLIARTAGWSRRRIMDAIDACVGGVHPCPKEFEDVMAQALDVPSWVDVEQIERGANFFMSTHAPGGVVLGARSLVLGYASPAGNKPLVMSGRLERSVNRRLAETSKFVYEVCRSQGMTPGGAGIASTLKVRLIHAKVRAMIAQTNAWDTASWGEPINQHDMLATILLFSHALLTGVKTLGMHVTEQEAIDYIALWRYVGYVIGVDEALLPKDPHDAALLFEFIDSTQGKPDDDARALTRVFLNGPPDNDPQQQTPKTARHAANAVARALLGEARADALGVAPSTRSGRLALRSAKAFVKAYDVFRRSPATRERAVQAGERYWAWIIAHNPAGAVELTLPDRLLRTSFNASKMSA